MRLPIIAALILLVARSYAQPSFPPPDGVFCSCGPTTGKGNGSVDPAIAAKTFVKGILVRAGWELLEPADNNYNWAVLDTQINRAKLYGKNVSLGIGCGVQIPQWVFDLGAQRLITSVPYNDTIAVPWNKIYLDKWTEFIGELGKRYKNDTTIRLVYMTHSTANGFEMQMPKTSTPTLSAIGYTDQKMSDSWKEVIDAFSAAFPDHYLSNDFHPVNNSDDVADTVYSYAMNSIGQRYGAAAWWWTQKNTTVYPSQYNIMKMSAANNAFSAVQFANNGTTDSAKFGPGGMPAALQLAINDGICYWEIWNNDILNPKFDSVLSNTACSPTNTTIVQQTKNELINIYPNPASGIVIIDLPDIDNEVAVMDVRGGYVSKMQGQRSSLPIDMSQSPRGIYIVRVCNIKGVFYKRIVLQ